MIGLVLTALAIADVILIVAFLSLQRRQAVSHNLVRELPRSAPYLLIYETAFVLS